MRVSALIGISKHAFAELSRLEESLRAELVQSGSSPFDCELHADVQIARNIELTINKKGRETAFLAVKRYCQIVEELETNISTHSESNLLKSILLNNTNEVKNYTMLSEILVRKKRV